MMGDDTQTEIHESNRSPSRPLLPPRPTNLSFWQTEADHGNQTKSPKRAGLIAEATTAVTSLDAAAGQASVKKTMDGRSVSSLQTSPLRNRNTSRATSVLGDNLSVRSFGPSSGIASDLVEEFDDGLRKSVVHDFEPNSTATDESTELLSTLPTVDFGREFAVIPDETEEQLAADEWQSKRKHFLIFSAAGKPIYSRHGSDSTISSYIGILQTIIATYQSWDSELQSFQSSGTLFVVLLRTNLFLVGITHLPESEGQVRSQLEALYMQILSTLTLPQLTHIFAVRPSTDLRRPLQGTEVLLSALADSFTRGSVSTLLQSLEALRIRKSHRQVINNTLLKSRTDALLYGLIVAGGRLVSVIRPKKHSLHPNDLQLISNMLFEAEGIKAGGGESFIPICLPGFNNTGFLHMYVAFLDVVSESTRELGHDEEISKENAVAIVLLSAHRESFEDLQSMRRYLVRELRQNGSMKIVNKALTNGRPLTTEIVPGTVVKHFLYKSRGNVQFFMPSYAPDFEEFASRRRLFSLYSLLQAESHVKHVATKVQHTVGDSYSALVWITPMFELYCVASPTVPRNALAQNANKIIQWIQREEERIFLIGGAVF